MQGKDCFFQFHPAACFLLSKLGEDNGFKLIRLHCRAVEAFCPRAVVDVVLSSFSQPSEERGEGGESIVLVGILARRAHAYAMASMHDDFMRRRRRRRRRLVRRQDGLVEKKMMKRANEASFFFPLSLHCVWLRPVCVCVCVPKRGNSERTHAHRPM